MSLSDAEKAKRTRRFKKMRDEAWGIYRDLDAPSARAVWEDLRSRYGKDAPVAHRTVEIWCTDDGWVERRKEHYAEVARLDDERSREERLAEIQRRRDARLEDTDLLRTVARHMITIKDGNVYRAARKGEVGTRVAAVAGQLLRIAGAEERLDLGEATVRSDMTSGDEPVSPANVIYYMPEPDPEINMEDYPDPEPKEEEEEV